MKLGIIYRARNKKNGMSYIGATTQTLAHRKGQHKGGTFGEKTKKAHYLFYQAIREYGWDNFEWTVLYKDIPEDMLEVAEMCAIYTYGTVDNGYNNSEGGKGPRGYSPTEITREKMRKARLGIVPWHAGKKMPLYYRESLSRAHGSHPFSVWRGEEYIGEWINQNECADALKINNRSISACLLGKRSHCHGYTFKYKDKIDGQ